MYAYTHVPVHIWKVYLIKIPPRAIIFLFVVSRNVIESYFNEIESDVSEITWKAKQSSHLAPSVMPLKNGEEKDLCTNPFDRKVDCNYAGANVWTKVASTTTQSIKGGFSFSYSGGNSRRVTSRRDATSITRHRRTRIRVLLLLRFIFKWKISKNRGTLRWNAASSRLYTRAFN